MRLSSRRGTGGDSPSAESSHRPLCRKRRCIGHPSRGRAEGARAQGSGRARKEDSRSSGHVGVSCRGWRVLDWGGLKELRRQGDGMGVRVFGVESMRCLVLRQDQQVCCRRVELAPLDWVKLLRRIFPAFWRSPCIYAFILPRGCERWLRHLICLWTSSQPTPPQNTLHGARIDTRRRVSAS